MLRQIADLLQRRGYSQIDEETNGILFRETNDVVYAVTLSDISQGMSVEMYSTIRSRAEFILATRFRKKVEVLHVVSVNDGMFEEQEIQMVEQLSNIWFVAKDTGKLYIFEHQVSDFDDLQNVFDESLRKYVAKIKKETAFTITPVNAVIVILNILVYIAVIILNRDINAVYDTDIMLSMGAMSYDTCMNGAWYRIVTSLFLHFGISHLLNNMVLLAYTGCELERRIGSVSYFLIYFGSGIIGNFVSLWYYNAHNEYVVSAGASGAIFGVIGALFVVLLVHQIKTPNLSPMQLFIMIGITIYHGVASSGVDNAAHIGGLCAGIIGGFLLSKISRYGKLE